jgi:hypothetical protein
MDAKLSAEVVSGPVGWSPRGSLAVSYRASPEVSLPFSGRASVEGRISDRLTGRPRPGVLVRLGDLVTSSDARGNYRFNLPGPGRAYLDVDRGTLAAGEVPDQPTPVEVVVRTGTPTVVDLAMIPGASLTGSVSLWNYPQATSVDRVEAGGLGNVVLELFDQSTTQRLVTNQAGAFEVPDLRPGRYTLRLASDSVPRYHRAEKESYEFVLGPADKRVVVVRVLEDKRGFLPVTTEVVEVSPGP